ncbi:MULTISPECIES: hypothetical protein [Chryseobacterium group]|uniref:DUF3945 domain-containing protein n=1 Tax=Chryseobacterium koreense CCUG 49689 TaxID=1304281 RepID=A0A0J7J2H2_9FLAO|nr:MULTISPECIES: hypothetical protein [Chryseobacterium group]KMQ72254.1 hypothetical protein ACM44_02045 [Chryseobacterium koreense CCUG 49689]MBB5334064.1 hypothetical protein [Chryseobacterium koreense]
MQTNNLPTEDLKKYGIVEPDNSFSKKLSAEDIQKFLSGYTIVADNDKNRATFQLVENNSRLNVVFLERDKNISSILAESKERIEYSEIKDLSKGENQLNFEKKAFVYDKETKNVVEFDLVKNAMELTAIIADKKDAIEINRYKIELQKLKSFLQDKMDQFPEIAKEITSDLNIVSEEINTINSISQNESNSPKQGRSEVQLNVNDPDLYHDAHRKRDEEFDQEEKKEKSRGFKR